MVGVAGNVAGVCALHFAGGVREAVPDGFALAVFAPGAFDLIGGGGRSPNEFVGKLERRETRLGFEKLADEAMAGRQDSKRCSGTKSGGENSRRLKLCHLFTDFLLGYGVRAFEWGVSGRRPNSMSRRMRAAPMAMAESATLKAG
jgi:hypothetical protein